MDPLRLYVRRVLMEDWTGQVPKSHHDTLVHMVEKHLDPTDPYHNPELHMFLSEVPYLGEGSSRVAYKIDIQGKEPFVFKVAKNAFGVSQNKTEINCGMLGHDITAEIYKSHPQHIWLEQELLTLVNGEQEFESLAGVSWNDFIWGIRRALQDGVSVTGVDMVDKVLDLIESCGLAHADITTLTHWGKDKSGRLKLLDFGFRGFAKHGKGNLGTYDLDAKTSNDLGQESPTRNFDEDDWPW